MVGQTNIRINFVAKLPEYEIQNIGHNNIFRTKDALIIKLFLVVLRIIIKKNLMNRILFHTKIN